MFEEDKDLDVSKFTGKDMLICSVIGVILFAVLFPWSAFSGPTSLKNDSLVAARVADDSARASTNYVSDDAYLALLNAANNVNDIKAALLKKATSDKTKADELKKQVDKVNVKKNK